MEEHGFVHKYGAVWTSSKSARVYDHDWEGMEPDYNTPIRFDERAQPGVTQNYTHHVDRGGNSISSSSNMPTSLARRSVRA